MPKYRKKPVEIEARRVTEETLDELAEWCSGTARKVPIRVGVFIDTLEGTMHAALGDFIIKGVQGEFYPCKADIFEQTYDPV